MTDTRTTGTKHRSFGDRVSTAVLIVALLIVGIIAYQTRPWEQPSGGPDALGLVGSASDAPRPTEQSPDFALLRADGSKLQLSDLRGKPVFLNFWATWCTFCLEEMPDMQRIAGEYDGQIVVLGVNVGDSVASGSGFAERVGVHYELVYDTDQEVTRGYSVRAMPTSYFISPDGEIADAHFGFMSYEDMREKIEALLAPTD